MMTWKGKCTEETRDIENMLHHHFEKVDAYRYNSVSIRIRVIDPRFEGLSTYKRDALVELQLEKLPEHTQADIMCIFTFAPSELQQPPKNIKTFCRNNEFEEPSPSTLDEI